MAVLHLLLAVVGSIVAVSSFPSINVAFPEDGNVLTPPVSGYDRFHHRGHRPHRHWHHEHPDHPPHGRHHRPDHYLHGPPPQGFRPSFSNPRGDSRGSRPYGNSQAEQLPIDSSSFSRPQDNFRPQTSRPFDNPEGSNEQDFRPQGSNGGFDTQDSFGSTPEEVSDPTPSVQPDFISTGSEQSQSQNQNSGISGSASSRPDLNLETSSFQPDFIDIGSPGQTESQSQISGLIGSGGSRPEINMETLFEGLEGLEGLATPDTPESTTKIPRRDPTNRIVYTVTCPCEHTFHYKPVCGSDGQTYGNIGVLQCAQKCGSNVTVFLDGSCGRNNGHPGAISLKY